MKLESAETKLQDLKSNMAILGKEAVAAMTAVEAQQQRLTLQRLISMVIQISFHIKYLSLFWMSVNLILIFYPILSRVKRLKLNVHIINESFRYLISLMPRYEFCY